MNPDSSPLHVMDRTTAASSEHEAKDIVQFALSANKKLQLNLHQRAEKLEAELNELDRLLAASCTEESEDDPESEIHIPGSKRATGLFPSSEFLNETSPFYDAARKRTDYLMNTNPRPLKDKDLETLADAVKIELNRLKSYNDATMSSTTGQIDTDEPRDLVDYLEGLNWTRIAERVSDDSSVARSAVECRIAWIAHKSPTVNHAEWSQSELSQLSCLVAPLQQENKPVNWVEIAGRLGTNRLPIDCMRHGTTRARHAWTSDTDQDLIEAVSLYGIDNWHLVARKVSGNATPSQCQARWTKSVDPSLKRRAWTTEEDERLRKAVEGYGQTWIQVATLIPGRTNDQCRERWIEHLNFGDQNLWTEAEDKVLRDSVQELGNKWKEISKRFKGKKTGQACRARHDKLKRALNRAVGQRSESSTPVPIPGPPPTLGSFQTILSTTPASSSTLLTLPSTSETLIARPRPTPRAVAISKVIDHKKLTAITHTAGGAGVVPLSGTLLNVAAPDPAPSAVESDHREPEVALALPEGPKDALTPPTPDKKRGRKRK